MRTFGTGAILLIFLGTVADLGAQVLKERRIAAPTRLDWQYASAGFKDDARADNYDPRKQRYQLYIPPNYQAGKAWPLILFISAGSGPGGWNSWKKACVKHDAFFCSAFQAGNSCPPGQRVRIVLDMLDDVRRTYRIDPDQTYVSGFSGGGRMACTIAFALPEWFGGVAPVCGTNPLAGPAYLRHRVRDRLSVAFVTGSKDFNRKENETYMYPWFQDLAIRTRLWVVPNMGHAIPSGAVLAEAYSWLAQDLPRRRKDAARWPGLAMSADQTPTADEQAQNYLDVGLAELKQPDHVWRGVTLLQGVLARWTKTEAGKQARRKLKSVSVDRQFIEAIASQGSADEQKSLTAQAKAFERFGLIDQAIRAWELLARNYPGSEIGTEAARQAKRLRDGQK